MGTSRHVFSLKDMGGVIKMKQKKILPLNLQFFAEDTSGIQENGKNSEGGASNGKSTEDTKPEDEKKYSDADLDRIINQKFAKWQQDSDEKLRQSQLSAEEKEKERIAKLEQLERDVARRDAIDESRKYLSENNLPEAFAKFVYDTDEEKAQEKFAEFKKAMNVYRESIVNEIMKDKTPSNPKASGKENLSWREKARQNYQKVKESE